MIIHDLREPCKKGRSKKKEKKKESEVKAIIYTKNAMPNLYLNQIIIILKLGKKIIIQTH